MENKNREFILTINEQTVVGYDPTGKFAMTEDGTAYPLYDRPKKGRFN